MVKLLPGLLAVLLVAGGCVRGPSWDPLEQAQYEAGAEIEDLVAEIERKLEFHSPVAKTAITYDVGQVGEVYAQDEDGSALSYHVALDRRITVGNGGWAKNAATRACYHVVVETSASEPHVSAEQVVCDPSLPTDELDAVLEPED